MLGKVVEPKRAEVTETWRKLPIEEPHDLYTSPKIRTIKKNKIGGTLARVSDRRGADRILVGGT
jgi:hypothetical protein